MNKLAKIPPQDVELEKAVLGAMLLEREALITGLSEIKPAFFYKDAHRLIAEAIISLYKSSSEVDLLTVTSELRKMGKLKEIGGAFYLTELTNIIGSGAHLSVHIKLIQEFYLKREMIRISSEMMNKSFDDSQDVFDLMNEAQLFFINIMSGVLSQQAIHIKQSTMEVMQEMVHNMNRKQNNQLTGIPTPIHSLNQFTGGWQKSDLIIIAARPAMGKTGLALSIARAAAKDKKSVLIFSLEMSHQKLTYRLIAQETKRNSVTQMQRGDISQAEINAMTMSVSDLVKYNIHIDDQASTSLMMLRSKANRMKSMHGLDMIIVDYLQLMSDDAGMKGNREQEISRISRGLKVLAKDLQIPVIALSQLSRAVETRGGDKKPQLSDLRESGSIEQDADMVIFLYRPEYYGITEFEHDTTGTISTSGLAIGNIAKHRNGPVGDFLMAFDAKHTDFMNFNKVDNQPEEKSFDWSRVEKNF